MSREREIGRPFECKPAPTVATANEVDQDHDYSPRYSRRAVVGLAATFALLPTIAGRAQAPAAKALRGLDVGPITWRNIRTDFGAVGNGTSSDFVAFRAFRFWALAQTGWVGLVIPPSSGRYVTAGDYGRGAINTPFFGIKKLVVSGYGASMDGLHGGALVNRGESRHKIRSVKAGSKTVELIQPSDFRFFSVGAMVLLAGFDLQGGWGYPPNSHFNEWHRIESVKGGRITFEKPIKYDYRDDWPRYFEGNKHELGGIGPAAICRTIPEWDCEHRIYGLRSTSPGQTYYFVRKAALIDVKSDAQGWIIGASEDHQIIGQEHTATHMEVDKLTTKALIGEYGPPEKNILVQSSSIDELHVRGGTRSIHGTARHTLITGGSSRAIYLGPTAYGISDSIEIRDRVITSAVHGTPAFGMPVSDFTFENSVLRYANYKRAPQWLVPGAVGVIRTVSPYLDHHVFKILSVRSENGRINGPILIETDIREPKLPAVIGFANAAFVRHNAPKLTVVNCTGCADAEELSLAPPNSPFGIIRRRTYDGSVAETSGLYLLGRLVHLKINVVQPYTGISPSLTLRLARFGIFLVKRDKSYMRSNFTINLKAAGERLVRPQGVTGTQAGDVNLGDLTGGIWMPGGGFGAYIGNGSDAVDISGESAAVRPIVVVEALTDQEI